jgi:hypothetical protein
MIVWLASYPRSGNTFLRALLYQVYGVHTHEFYDKDLDPASFEVLSTIFGADPADPSLDDMKRSNEYFLVKTHDMPEEDYPAIYIVRDGRDALVSHAHFVLQYDQQLPPDVQRERFDDTLKMLVETDASFGGWSGNVRAWTTRSTKTAIVRFEDLVRKPLDTIRPAMEDVGYTPSELPVPNIPMFEELRGKLPAFFRKGRIGSWREEMREDLHELFWKRHGAMMDAMGYGSKDA